MIHVTCFTGKGLATSSEENIKFLKSIAFARKIKSLAQISISKPRNIVY